MSWDVQVVCRAQKSFNRLQKLDKIRVKEALSEMKENPFAGDLVWLTDTGGEMRRRVGNWRILFSLDAERKIVWVKDIDRRTTTTYKKR